jgi:hypothetical protein
VDIRLQDQPACQTNRDSTAVIHNLNMPFHFLNTIGQAWLRAKSKSPPEVSSGETSCNPNPRSIRGLRALD